MTISALYDGAVTHQRLRPRRHHLRYRLFYLLLDLDELPGLARRLRLFSHDRFNLFSFHDRDHGAGERGGLRAWIEAQLRAAGLAPDGGKIRVLCMPRILGHAFNPITVYWCHCADGALLAMLYEVNNTFGERHFYLMPAHGDGPARQSCDKRFHVSPFMTMDMTYRFRVTPPDRHVTLAINAADGDGLLIATAFTGARTALTDAALLGRFLRTPLLGMKVLAAIHWEAARLWWKGVRLQPRPAARRLPTPVPTRPICRLPR